MMQIMNNKDYKLFEQLVGATQREMHYSLKAYLEKKYDTVINTEDYIVAIGDIPIALLAHMDTVFPTPVKELYYDRSKNVIWSPDGLGSDDRAGIFAIIKIIQAGLRPSIIFTTDEEKGGLGSAVLAQEECPIPGLKYLIQLDRRNDNDCVFYDCNNQDFIKYVESFGFAENIGSFTDISNLMPEWKVCGVNLSVGYQDEHTKQERLFVTSLMRTIEKVKVMLSEKDIPTFKFSESVESAWYSRYFKHFYSDEDIPSAEVICSRCKQVFSEYEVFPVLGADGSTKFYCPDCIVDKVNWCRVCGQAYEITDPTRVDLCDKCAEAILV